MKTGTTRKRRGATVLRVAALLMVTGVAACDNVEWGGVEVTVVPPPPRTAPAQSQPDPGDLLPRGPILYHVTRDSSGPTLVPVGEIADQALRPLSPGEDSEGFGERYRTAFMAEGSEFTLFRDGRRAGTLVVDSAWIPDGACRPLPRATGTLELGGGAEDAPEFLAMARAQAPEGRMIGRPVRAESRMEVVGSVLAERALRARGASVADWTRARRQIRPFPVSETQDLAFTATYLTEDELGTGGDDEGYSLFVVFTPQSQAGYDTAYVAFADYAAAGKAAPRTIDFLDWDRDGEVELLLEVFGTTDAWYAAVDRRADGWRRAFEDRCEPELPPLPLPAPDTAQAAPAGPAGSAPAQ